MKLFLDMRPAFDTSLPPLANLSFGLAAAALAQGAEDVFFVRDFAPVSELPEPALLPSGFVEWALTQEWSDGTHLRKLADQAVQEGRLDKALAKYEAETRVAMLVAPLSQPEQMRPFETVVLATEDLSVLRFPELPEAPWEQGWRRSAPALFARADLICCASESVWRDYQALSGAAAPAVVTPTAPPVCKEAPGEGLASEPVFVMWCDRGVLWEPFWAGLRETVGPMGGRLDLLHRPTQKPPAVPADLAEVVVVRQASDPTTVCARSQPVAWLDLSATSTAAHAARQANCLGVPVIAAIGRGASELCDSSTTQLADPQNPAAIAAAMSQALQAPLTAEARWALASRSTSENWVRAGARILDAARTAALRGDGEV